MGLLIHKGEEKAAGGDLHPGVAKGEVWLVANEHGTFAGPPDWSSIPVGTLAKSHAHWWVAGLVLRVLGTAAAPGAVGAGGDWPRGLSHTAFAQLSLTHVRRASGLVVTPGAAGAGGQAAVGAGGPVARGLRCAVCMYGPASTQSSLHTRAAKHWQSSVPALPAWLAPQPIACKATHLQPA